MRHYILSVKLVFSAKQAFCRHKTGINLGTSWLRGVLPESGSKEEVTAAHGQHTKWVLSQIFS